MRKIYRNIVKGYSFGRCMAIAENNASKYNETWYVLGDSGMAANAKGRRGYEQFPALSYAPDGTMGMVEAQPRQ